MCADITCETDGENNINVFNYIVSILKLYAGLIDRNIVHFFTRFK